MLGLCDRWYKTPDEIMACDTRRLLWLLRVEEIGGLNDERKEAAAAGYAGAADDAMYDGLG